MIITKKYTQKMGIKQLKNIIRNGITIYENNKKIHFTFEEIFNIIVEESEKTTGRFDKITDIFYLELDILGEKNINQILDIIAKEKIKLIRFYEIVLSLILESYNVNFKIKIKDEFKKMEKKLINNADQFNIKMFKHANESGYSPYYSAYTPSQIEINEIPKNFNKNKNLFSKEKYLSAKTNEEKASVLMEMYKSIEDQYKKNDSLKINKDLSRLINKYNIRHGDTENKENIKNIKNIFGEESENIIRLHYDRIYILIVLKMHEINNWNKENKSNNKSNKENVTKN